MKKIKLLLSLIVINLFFGCSSSSDVEIPVLSPTFISSITSTGVISGGVVSSDGDGSITSRGVVWSLSSSPTVLLSTKTTNGNGSGSFVSQITGLEFGTTYYVRAYATNSAGTGYGDEIEVSTLNEVDGTVADIDGNNYQIVAIGTQNWMQKNLEVTKYKNGDPIPQVSNPAEWINLTTGAWCYNQNDTNNGIIYGKLYNWYAVNDPRGLAPEGYHVPSDNEWTNLLTFLGDNNADKMRETSAVYWQSSTTISTNSSGFTALPGGHVNFNGNSVGVGVEAIWWSSTFNTGTEYAWVCDMNYQDTNARIVDRLLGDGYSIRCVKN